MDEVKVKITLNKGSQVISYIAIFLQYEMFNEARIEAIRTFEKAYGKKNSYFNIDKFSNTRVYSKYLKEILIWEII